MKMSEFLHNNDAEYVDIPVGVKYDEERFIDMYTIIHQTLIGQGYQYKDRIIAKVGTFFEEVLKATINDDIAKHEYLSQNLHEPKYTMIGYSRGGSGQAFGKDKYKILVDSIKSSTARKTGKINDILDAELYTDDIGVDLISDLVTNLIQDVLSEYTEEVLHNIYQDDKIIKIKTHYWDEQDRKWKYKDMSMINYYKELTGRRYYYLLVPEKITKGKDQKEVILKNIFNNCIYQIYSSKILLNQQQYDNYIHRGKSKDEVYMYQAVYCMKDELGIKHNGSKEVTIKSKSLLDLVERYPEIIHFIDTSIKNKEPVR